MNALTLIGTAVRQDAQGRYCLNDLLRLAQSLTALTDMAKRLPLSGKHWRPTHINLTFQEEKHGPQD
jgi:hypothetical protein